MRDRRVQFLPVQWRTSFDLSADEESRREAAGLDNDFTLDGKEAVRCPNQVTNSFGTLDITIKNTVPYVRELMNNVLIDIPYFLRQVFPSLCCA